MNKQNLICIICPRGCHLSVTKTGEDYEVAGNFCNRGIAYGIKEVTRPERKVTSTVRIKDAIYPRLPVITDREVPKGDMMKIMDEINKAEVSAPVYAGEVIIEHVLGSEANIIASRTMEKVIK